MRGGLARLAPLALAFVVQAGCGRSPPGKGSASVAAEPSADLPAALGPADARERAQWEAADAGDAEELMRLADLLGCEGLHQRALEQASSRGVALRAMRYCRDLLELPWLAEVAAGADDSDARLALEAIGELAARPRRATDPDDAFELHEGCAGLLELARATKKTRERRVLAVGALRMLAERGCVARSEIPAELDAR